jgi:hypothetical protein
MRGLLHAEAGEEPQAHHLGGLAVHLLEPLDGAVEGEHVVVVLLVGEVEHVEHDAPAVAPALDAAA